MSSHVIMKVTLTWYWGDIDILIEMPRGQWRGLIVSRYWRSVDVDQQSDSQGTLDKALTLLSRSILFNGPK